MVREQLEKIINSEGSTKRQPGSCPLKVEVLDQPGHLLLIEASDAVSVS